MHEAQHHGRQRNLQSASCISNVSIGGHYLFASSVLWRVSFPVLFCLRVFFCGGYFFDECCFVRVVFVFSCVFICFRVFGFVEITRLYQLPERLKLVVTYIVMNCYIKQAKIP